MTYQTVLLRCPLLHFQKSMPVDSENPRLLQLSFDVLMLMPMDQKPGLLALDILGQRREAGMDAIRLVMDAERGIM